MSDHRFEEHLSNFLDELDKAGITVAPSIRCIFEAGWYAATEELSEKVDPKISKKIIVKKGGYK